LKFEMLYICQVIKKLSIMYETVSTKKCYEHI